MFFRYMALILVFVSSVYSYDFGKAYWGDSEEDVIDNEDSRRQAEDEDVIDINTSTSSLTYNGVVSNYYAEINYVFKKNDGLIEGWYRFDFRRDETISRYKEVAENLMEALETKYGKCIKEVQERDPRCECPRTIRTWKTNKSLIKFTILNMKEMMPKGASMSIHYYELGVGVGGL